MILSSENQIKAMSLTLRQIRYFVATSPKSGQISQAAIHLNISQSAVTTAIKELEAQLARGCSYARPRRHEPH